MSPLVKGLCFSLLLLGCSGGDDFDYCSNPLGTSAQQGADEDVICLQSCGDDCYTGCLKFDLNAATPTMRAVLFTGIIPGILRQAQTKDCPTTGPCPTITDAGVIDCMDTFVKNKTPTTGSGSVVPLIAGHGYVVSLADGTAGYIYLDNLASTSGEMKANILWFYPGK